MENFLIRGGKGRSGKCSDYGHWTTLRRRNRVTRDGIFIAEETRLVLRVKLEVDEQARIYFLFEVSIACYRFDQRFSKI